MLVAQFYIRFNVCVMFVLCSHIYSNKDLCSLPVLIKKDGCEVQYLFIHAIISFAPRNL